MNGYYWPNFREGKNEHVLLDFNHIEHISEDTEKFHNFLGPPAYYSHKCPRCQSVNKIMAREPYCPQCNWDYLTDPGRKQNFIQSEQTILRREQ